MRLDMERICQLAGVKNNSRKKSGYGVLSEGKRQFLNESSYYINEEEEKKKDDDEEDDDKDKKDDKKEGMHGGDDHSGPMDEVIEVDEAMLVQELRRARRLMKESRDRKQAKKQKLQEMQLKGIIDQEVKNVLNDLQLNSGWIYGKNRPRRSRKGYVHQGNFLKGIGFK
jgi:hypothetical protein